MACLSKHGTEIGRITFTTTQKAYMSDGTVLKRVCGDWKVAGKVKSGFSVQDHFERAKAHQEQYLANHPALVPYRKALHSIAGMGKAWKLDMAISMMPDDPDGVWSDCCDGYSDNVHADLDEIYELCRLYKAASAESVELKQIAA